MITTEQDPANKRFIDISIQKAYKFFNAGYREQALDLCKDLLSSFPENNETKLILARMYRKCGKTEDSLSLLSQIHKQSIFYADALFEIGMIMISKRDLAGGISRFSRLLVLDGTHVEAHNNLAICLMDMARYQEAYHYFSRAAKLAPDNEEIYNNLGNLFVRCDRYHEARKHYKKAIELKSDYAGAYNNLGRVASYEGEISEAIVYFQKALELNPSYTAAADNLLFVLNNSDRYTPEQICGFHLHLAHLYNSTSEKCVIMKTDRKWNKIRIGYVSADFRDHSVGFFIEPVLNHHCKNSFDVFCYDQATMPDEATCRMMQIGWTWRTVHNLSDKEMCDMIRTDAIDILIDLSGHSVGNRLGVFALRPAPIQVTWLGYPNTTGLQQIDFRLTDELADPTGMSDHLYSEKLVRLPQTFLCFSPPKLALDVAPLPSAAFTFCCFNNYPKVSDTIVELWSRILQATPGSKLYIKSRPLGNMGVRHRLTERFSEHNIDSSRLIIAGFESGRTEHLHRYEECHVALDTFPYNGTTTTCEALWMGVPVVTLAGTSHASRVGLSILHNVGLSELIALNAEQYIDIAVTLAQNPDRLMEYRNSLRTRLLGSPLLDATTFTDELEQAYRRMFDRTERYKITS